MPPNEIIDFVVFNYHGDALWPVGFALDNFNVCMEEDIFHIDACEDPKPLPACAPEIKSRKASIDRTSEIKILPNPTTIGKEIKIQFNTTTFFNNNIEISILDNSQKRVKHFFYKITSNEISLDLENLPSGNYLLQLSSDEGIAIKKLLIAN